MILLCVRRHYPPDIPRQGVNLDIKLSSRGQIPKRRLLRRMGNDVDRKVSASVRGLTNVVDGEGYAVEGN